MDYAILKLPSGDLKVPFNGDGGAKEVRVRKDHWCYECGAEIKDGTTALVMRYSETGCVGRFRPRFYRSDYYCSGCYEVRPEDQESAKN